METGNLFPQTGGRITVFAGYGVYFVGVESSGYKRAKYLRWKIQITRIVTTKYTERWVTCPH